MEMLVIWIICVFVALFIGAYKGRVLAGLSLGVLLGPLGALIAAFVPPTVEESARRQLRLERELSQQRGQLEVAVDLERQRPAITAKAAPSKHDVLYKLLVVAVTVAGLTTIVIWSLAS